jgi:rubrerythrin
MQNLLSLILMMIMAIFMACSGQQENKTAAQKQQIMMAQVSGKIYYYTCPMPGHKNIHSDMPGKCPECGMDLVAAVATAPDSADFYGCRMPEHSHIRLDKPGNCPECNMKLVPMRLENKTNM